MARVWGATAPTRLALLLLLMAMCSQKTCAAPWRASGTGGWAEMGPKLSGTGGERPRLLSLLPCATLPWSCLPWGCAERGRRQHPRSWLRMCGSSGPQGWLQPRWAMALPLAEHGLHPGVVLGESSGEVCWEKREHFCSGFLVLSTDESQFPTKTPGWSPEEETGIVSSNASVADTAGISL